MNFLGYQRTSDVFRNPGRLAWPCLMAVLIAATPAGEVRAGIVTFFGIDQGNGTPPTTPNLSLAARTSFLGALNTVGVENFESAATGTPPATLSFTGSGVTATATYSPTETINNAADSGTVATSGTHYLDAGQGIRDDKLVFSAPVAGVGFYITDLSDGGLSPDQISIIATLVGGGTQTFTTNVGANNANANVLFFGIASNDPTVKFSQVEILNTFTSEDDVHGLDDLTIGVSPAAVPEPSSLVLLGIGLLTVSSVRVLRQRLRSSRV